MTTTPIRRIVPRAIDSSGASDTKRFLRWDPVTEELSWSGTELDVRKDGAAVAAHAGFVDFYGSGVSVSAQPGGGVAVVINGVDPAKLGGKFRGVWAVDVLAYTQGFSSGSIPAPFTTANSGQSSPASVVAGGPTGYANSVRLQVNNYVNTAIATMTLNLANLGIPNITRVVSWTLHTGTDHVTTRILRNNIAASDVAALYGWTQRTVSAGSSDTIVWQQQGIETVGVSSSSQYQITGVEVYNTPDPYMLGQYVAYQGLLWVSNIDNNASVPGADANWSPVMVAGRAVTAQTGTSYTLAAGDLERTVTMTNAAASTLTIPTNATVPGYPTGGRVEVLNLGAGTVTIAGASGVTVNTESPASLTVKQYQRAILTKTATDTWHVAKQHQGSLANLTDVNLTTPPTDLQALLFDAASGKWKPGTITGGGGGGATALAALSDVNLSTAPTDQQVLKFDAASSKWKAGTDNTGSGGAPARQVLRLTKTATQSLANTATTVITWATAARNSLTNATWSSSTNPSRITSTVAGQYRVTARGLMQGGSAGGYLAGHLVKNGTNIDTDFRHTSSGNWVSTHVDSEVTLQVGDYVEFSIEQSTGGAKNSGAASDNIWIEVEYLGPVVS